MSEFCLNCNNPLPKGVQSTFCSRTCWQAYKEKKGSSNINPERQATVMLKDTSRSLVTSLKSEIDKKDEIIRHQDKLIHEYRESLESREREILKLQAKMRYYEGVVSELRQQHAASTRPAESTGQAVFPRSAEPSFQPVVQKPRPEPVKDSVIQSIIAVPPPPAGFAAPAAETPAIAGTEQPSTRKSFWQRLFHHS